MEIIDLCTAPRGAVEQDMVRIDPMTAIPRWEERTVLQENHMKLFLNGVPEEKSTHRRRSTPSIRARPTALSSALWRPISSQQYRISPSCIKKQL